MKSIKRIIDKFSIAFSDPKDYRSQDSSTFKSRDGKAMPVDEAFVAWTTGTLDQMIEATNSKTHPIDRHFLLQRIVRESYKLRKDRKHQEICLKFANKHLDEFDELASALKKDMDGVLPRITVFQHHATVLTENGDFNQAIEICNKAIEYQLHDGTQSGFEGRIERILKKMD